MALLLTVVVMVCFIAALLPFMLPGAVIGLLGKVLNDALGDPMWAFIPAMRGIGCRGWQRGRLRRRCRVGCQFGSQVGC